MSRRLMGWSFLGISLVLLGCSPSYEEITWLGLKEELSKSGTNSADAWWYCGQKDGYRYFVISLADPPVAKNLGTGFRVAAAEVSIEIKEDFDFTKDPSKWHHLKTWELVYPREGNHVSTGTF